MNKTKRNIYILTITAIISIISSIIRVQIGTNDGLGLKLFFGNMAFPLSITLLYFMPQTEEFSDKFKNYIFTILVIAPITLGQLYIENYFIKKNNTILAIINSAIYNSSESTNSSRYYFEYKIKDITYSKSVNVHTKDYNIGDSVRISVSVENPDHYEIIGFIKRNP